MKLALSVVLVVSVLVGCSPSGNGNGGGGLNDDIFQKNLVPASPASMSYLKDTLKSLKDSEPVLPDESTIFTIVLDGDDTKYVTNDELKKERDKLSVEGLGYLNAIKAKCTIANATVLKDTNTISENESSISSTGSMKTSGVNCPYLISNENSSHATTKYLAKTQNFVHVVGSIVSTMKMARKINDPAMLVASGFKSMTFELSTKTNTDMQATDSSNVKGTFNSTANGNLDIQFANGEYIKGPVTMVMNGTFAEGEPKMTLQILFDGMSPQGAVRLVAVNKNEGEPEFYVNGQKMDLSELEGLGLNFDKDEVNAPENVTDK